MVKNDYQVVQNYSQMVPNDSGMVPNDSQMATNDSQLVTNDFQMVSDDYHWQILKDWNWTTGTRVGVVDLLFHFNTGVIPVFTVPKLPTFSPAQLLTFHISHINSVFLCSRFSCLHNENCILQRLFNLMTASLSLISSLFGN